MTRLEGLVPPSVELWLKHDDASGTVYGGNKVRKLEFLLGEARARGARRLVTLGAIGSHHVLATAIYGRQAGFAVDAVVFPQPLTDARARADARRRRRRRDPVSDERLPRRAAGAWRRAGAAPTSPGSPRAARRRSARSATCRRGSSCSSRSRAASCRRPDVIYVALGSCGTAAGLLVGLAGSPSLPRLDARVVAVRVVDRVVSNARVTRRLAASTAALLAARGEHWFNRFEPPPLTVEHRFFGGAYGRATPASDDAVARAAAAGVALEPTYTGKAMAALLADADAGLLDGKRVLFVNTYSSVDLAPFVAAGPGVAALPPALQRHFDAGASSGKH